MPKKKTKKPAIPSSGERWAKMGYYAQDYYCAGLLVSALANNQLESIRIADPKAGRVDDFQLAREGRVDAWQVKWHTYSGYTTINDLISDGDGQSLIAQLADGRNRIKAVRAGRRVVVHLATNNLPSQNDTKIPGDGGTGMHTAAFMAECWHPIRHGTITFAAAPKKWKPWLDAIRKASGLSVAQFPEFVRDCELEFGCTRPVVSDVTRDAQAKRDELEHVTHFLYEGSGAPENIIELTRAELIARLNLTDNFALRNRHEFPVDERRYEPIGGSVQQLHALLDQKTAGYLCLLGTPGAGKSTLLTKALQDRSERIIRYYAFIPGDLTLARGESDNFLHDFVVTLQAQGVATDSGPMDLSNRATLQQKFTAQLQALGKEWADAKKKTIILIDGLDHIDREQHPQRSLLDDLPAPATVPEGVLFVLGTQTDAVVPERVQHQLNSEAERKITIGPLSHSAVGDIIRRGDFGNRIEQHHYDRIFDLSAGHPLALSYLLNKIEAVATAAEVDAILNAAHLFAGNIEADYAQYWHDLTGNHPNVVPLLSLICRIRRTIDLDWAASWTPEAQMKELVQTSGHLFKKETATRWYFFHNSFRLFLAEKTALDYLGNFSPTKDKELHKTLADHCHAAESPATWKWQELYHRAMAAQHTEVLELTNQDAMRAQFFAGRAQSSIQVDLSLATASLAKVHDGIAAIRIGLISDELSQRYNNLQTDKVKLITMLIETGQVEKALFWIRDANRLIIADSYALDLCEPLVEQGYQVEAKSIFDLIDPFSFFDGVRGGFNPEQGQMEALSSWFYAARLFVDLDHCLKTVGKYRFKIHDRQEREIEPANDAENARLHAKLKLRLTYGSLHSRQWADFNALSAGVPKGTAQYRDLMLMASRARLDDGEDAFARQILETNQAENFGQGLDEKFKLAEITARLNGLVKCRELMAGVEAPALNRTGMGIPNGFDCFKFRFRYYRLAYYCGENRSPVELITSEHEGDEHTVHFLRCLAIIARLWAKAWLGEPANFADVRTDLNNVLRFYHLSQLDMDEWKDGSRIFYSRSDFLRAIVRACAATGKEMIDGLCTLLDDVWSGTGVRWWPTEVQIEMINELVRAGAGKDWAIQWLNKIWPDVNAEKNAQSFVYKCSSLAEAYLIAGDIAQAAHYFDIMVERSFGIGDRKDHQLTTWVQLFEELAPTLPDKGLAEIEWLAQSMASLEDDVGSHACKEALAELLGVCVSSNLDRTFYLFSWMEDQECIHYEEALRSMLKRVIEGRRDPILHVVEFIRTILIPISLSAAPSLLRDSIIALHRDHPDQVRPLVQRLTETINAQASSEVREKWLNGLARGLATCGLDLPAYGLDVGLLNWSDQHAARERVSLQDDSSRAFGELETQLTTAEKVIEVLGQESKSSHFAWASLLKIIDLRFDAPGIVKIVAAFEGKRDYCAVIEAMSAKLVDLGAKDVLWDLCQKGIENSRDKTWQRYMDGGPRLLIYTALMRADPTRGLPLLFSALAAEGAPYQDNIRLLLPYLVLRKDYPAVWNELKNHLAALVAGSELNAPASPNLSAPGASSPDDLLSSIARRNLTHPIIGMRQNAQAFFFRLTAVSDASTHGFFASELAKDSPSLPAFMEILDGVAMVSPDVLEPLKASIEKVQAHRSYDVRALFLEICDFCGWDFSEESWSTGELSPMYNLALPPDSEAPFDFGIFRHQHLRMIADITGLDLAHLSYRLLQLWRATAGDDSGDISMDHRVGRHLENLGLGMTYSKPRAQILTRAFNVLLNELAEAGVIPFDSYRALPFLFRNCDPYFIGRDPSPRPRFLAPFFLRNDAPRFDDTWWMGMIDIANRVPLTDADGWHIVASTARFRCANGESPTEQTASAVLAGSAGDSQQPAFVGENLFGKDVEAATDYFGYSRPWDGRHCAVRSFGLPWARGLNFIGFHPALARQLGWQPSTRGLLDWVDPTGRLMAETVWWQDGPVDRRTLWSNIEISNGWHVVLSPAGLEHLTRSVGPLRRERHAERIIDKHGNTSKAGVQLLREVNL